MGMVVKRKHLRAAQLEAIEVARRCRPDRRETVERH